MHVLDLDSWRSYDEAFAAAKKALSEGEMIIYPTDTLYGLGANALDAKAVAKVVAAKGREDFKPISIVVSELEMLCKYAEVPDKISITLQELLPGSFTIILKAKPGLPKQISPDGKVGIRMPHYIFTTTLVRQLKFPITATSANLSGEKEPSRISHVPAAICKKAAAVIDGGPTRWGCASTVIDFTLDEPKILRKGANLELAEQVLCQQ